jgi:hypothetical protein
MKGKTIFSIIIAILLTTGAIVYQRMTGPTQTRQVNFAFNEQTYNITLPRTSSTTDDCRIILERKELTLSANLIFKKYPSHDAFDTLPFQKEGEILVCKIPVQPPAGKLVYYMQVTNGEMQQDVVKDQPVVIRFRGHVPVYWLIPHIIFMFLAMFLANLSGMLAIFRNFRFRVWSILTLLVFIIGGMFLGPMVQKYASVPIGQEFLSAGTLLIIKHSLLLCSGSWL